MNKEWKQTERRTWSLIGANKEVLAKVTKLAKDAQWRLVFGDPTNAVPEIWHLVDESGKVLAKVSREAFKPKGNWIRWSCHNFSCSNHAALRNAAKEAERDFL